MPPIGTHVRVPFLEHHQHKLIDLALYTGQISWNYPSHHLCIVLCRSCFLLLHRNYNHSVMFMHTLIFSKKISSKIRHNIWREIKIFHDHLLFKLPKTEINSIRFFYHKRFYFNVFQIFWIVYAFFKNAFFSKIRSQMFKNTLQVDICSLLIYYEGKKGSSASFFTFNSH